MSRKTAEKLAYVGVILSLFISACNMPRGTSTPMGSTGAVYTAAAQTVSAQLTKAAGGDLEPIDTPSPDQTAISTGTPFSTPTPESTTPVSGTTTPATEAACDRMSFIKDVNYPDGTDLLPGEDFTKTWQIKNTGTCTWTPGYSLVFDRGDAMGGPASKRLVEEDVEPGETVDISVDLQAPEGTGTYQGFWKLRNASGQVFGTGEDSSKAFWVKIEVVKGSGVMFDFNLFADDAAWGSGTLPIDYESLGDSMLVYGNTGDPGDPFVDVKTEQKLEDGRISGYLLVTYPPVGEDRYIIGRYPDYNVNPGDALFGRVGLIKNPDDTCGSGDVTYKISYTINGDLATVEELWKWNEICDGETKSIRLELEDLEGKNVQFYLIVIANTGSEDNYAVWDSLAIKR